MSLTPVPTQPQIAHTGARVELARYLLPGGERILVGQRIDGAVAVIDLPASSEGRVYLVERSVATAGAPLAGPIHDEITIGVDEDANLVWAVERRLGGRDMATAEDPPPQPPAALAASGRPGFTYRIATRIPPHWHPYVVEEADGRRRFVQGRAADL